MDETDVAVDAVAQVGPDAIAIALETPEGFDARPGQFVKLHATVDDVEVARFYTISSPDVTETFELTVGIDPDGELTPALQRLESGSTVTVSGPYGNAYYEDESSVVILAGGPGIGPAVGIAERALTDGGEAAIVYRDDEPIHEERLRALEADGVPVHVIGTGESMVDPVREVHDGDAQVFVYGFASFLDAATDAIAAAGGKPDAAKVENFG